mmetsp:Transcript_33177/g.50841  ORF Transcript_33177/g.50841 Transcript_33177/m.50841 type:complete len:123 (+) Transcript_33177:83-451(+)
MTTVQELTLSFGSGSVDAITIPPHAQFLQVEDSDGMCVWAFSTSTDDVWELGRSVMSQYYTSFKYSTDMTADTVTVSPLRNGTMPLPCDYSDYYYDYDDDDWHYDDWSYDNYTDWDIYCWNC